MTGTVLMHLGGDKTGTAVLQADSTGRSRIILNAGGTTRTDYSSGHGEDPACTYTTSDGRVKSSAIHNCWLGGTFFFPVFTFSTALQNGQVVFVYDGPQNNDGTSALKLTTQRLLANQKPDTVDLIRHLSTQKYFFDPDTFLLNGISYFVHPDNDARTDIPAEIRFADYRDVNGVKIPFHIEKLVNGYCLYEINLTDVAFSNDQVTP